MAFEVTVFVSKHAACRKQKKKEAKLRHGHHCQQMQYKENKSKACQTDGPVQAGVTGVSPHVGVVTKTDIPNKWV